jgi:zinc protease
MADLVFNQIVFAGHPYGRPEEGWPETVQAITRDDLLEFHRTYFGPQGMVVAVVGAIEPQQAVEHVARALGGWRADSQQPIGEVPSAPALDETVRRHHAIPGKAQSDVILGTSGPRRKDPEFLATSLGNSVLGQFGMMGRIGDVVREKAGLAYYAYSSLSSGIGPGIWQVHAGVNPANVRRATDLIVEELRRFVRDGVTVEELADSQANYVGRLPLTLESNGGVGGALLNIERYDLGLDYYREYAGLVRAVSTDDVLAAARKHIDPERLGIATAGTEPDS